MKSAMWWFFGMCAATAGWMMVARRQQPVEQLAHKLEEAWADHHTVV